MATVFTEVEKNIFDQATHLHRTQAFIISVSEEEDKVAMYQCRVLPDLIDLENEQDCPWYPHMRADYKESLQTGDLVWIYVSADLATGFVQGKGNIKGDIPQERLDMWNALKDGVDGLEDGDNVSFGLSPLSYVDSFYTQPIDGHFIFYDKSTNTLGMLDAANSSAIMYSSGSLNFVNTNINMTGDFHIDGSVKVGAGESPATRYNEMIEIIEELEDHIHVSPSGPVELPVGRDFMPLSAKLVQLKNTLASISVELD